MVSAVRTLEPVVDIQELIDPQAKGYAGEISPKAAYDYLKEQPAVLVDVRTQPEWQFTGVPDLRATPSDALFISWKTYPQFQLNPDFANTLSEQLPAKEIPIFFLCRSGGRSLDAAIAMTQHGYRYCFNITGGFEGEPDASGRRCLRESWKTEGLPWSQT